MKKPSMSIVIATHRRAGPLRELLGSLERQSRKIEYEVLVVATLPEVGLKRVVESYGPRFRFLETGRLGLNIARNKGLDRARGEIVLMLDDDCYVPDKDFLERVWNLHVDHPQALAIGGEYSLAPGSSACETAYHLVLDHRFRSMRRKFDSSTALLGGNFSFKPSMLGGRLRFDETNLVGGADLELFAQLARQGHELLALDAVSVVHRPDVNPIGLVRRAHAHGYASAHSKDRVGVRHWNSTLAVRECAESLGVAWTRSISFYVGLYQRVFSISRSTALAGAARAPLTWGRFLSLAWFALDAKSRSRGLLAESRRLLTNASVVARAEASETARREPAHSR